APGGSGLPGKRAGSLVEVGAGQAFPGAAGFRERDEGVFLRGELLPQGGIKRVVAVEAVHDEPFRGLLGDRKSPSQPVQCQDVSAKQAGPVGRPLVAGAPPLVGGPHVAEPIQFDESAPHVRGQAVYSRVKVAQRTHMTHRYPQGTGKTSSMPTYDL